MAKTTVFNPRTGAQIRLEFLNPTPNNEKRGLRTSVTNSNISLDAQEEEFSGTSKIFFHLKKLPESSLTIDFHGGKVASVLVNATNQRFKYNGNFISFGTSHLKLGENQLSISFSRVYSNDGSGLYRFKDPKDGLSYVYTDFEPYDANQLFPHFDQPDLKATYELEVIAPRELASHFFNERTASPNSAPREKTLELPRK